MDKQELIATLKTIITPYAQDEAALENLNEDTDFIKDLKINSANLVDLVLDLEEQFDIEIDNDSMAKMLNVSSSLEVIEAKLAAKKIS